MIRACGLVLCAVMAWGQGLSDADAAALIERSRQKALDYTRSLPDFECTELIHRSLTGSSNDTLTVKLRYEKQQEEHKLIAVNGKPTNRNYEDLGGATASGEFGGVLRMIFDPGSQAAFDWKSWKMAANRRLAVFDYAVSASNSPYYIKHGGLKGIVGLHGEVEVDSVTGEILRFTYLAYEIPKRLNIQSASSFVEYGVASVGGRTYLLPARSQTEMKGSGTWALNRTEFRDYHKFSADSVVDFGTGK